MIKTLANLLSWRESPLDSDRVAPCQAYHLELEPSICNFILVDDAAQRCPKLTSDHWLFAISASPRPTRLGRMSSRWDAVFQAQCKVF
jgi:hypothetical protein